MSVSPEEFFARALAGARLKRELAAGGATLEGIANYGIPRPGESREPEPRNCGTGAGGFKPGNKCALGSDGIPDVHDLEHDSDLGGSTGAALMRDSKGRKFVVKSGNSPEHVESEYLADRLYAAIGAPVPAARMSTRDGEPAKVAEYVAGKPLAHLSSEAKQEAYAKLREHFVADALLANWDVIGMGQDNIIVDGKGTPYRIDNGGSLKFRAQGAPKTFGPEVGEIDTLRTSNQGRPVFGSITDDEIARQVADIVKRRDSILNAAASNPEVQSTLSKRIDYLARKYGRADEARAAAALDRARIALRNCGTGKGGFQPGNTCAKGADGALAAEEQFIEGHIGDAEADAAYNSIFVTKSKTPSDLLRAAGWNGEHSALRPLDDVTSMLDGSLTEEKKRAFAGSVAGVAMAIKMFPELKDLKVFASTVQNEQAKRRAEFERTYLPRTQGEDAKLTPEEYKEALEDELRTIEGTPGFYEPLTGAVTLVAGTDVTPAAQEDMYSIRYQSSASPLHVGLHEAIHALHYRKMRSEYGFDANGRLSGDDFNRFADRMEADLKQVLANPPAALTGDNWRDRLSTSVSKYGASNARETVAEYNTGVILGGIKKTDELDALMEAYRAPVPPAPAARGRKTATLEDYRKAGF